MLMANAMYILSSFLTKKPPVVGAAFVSFACVCAYLALTAAIPTTTRSLRIRTEIKMERASEERIAFIGKYFARL